MWHVHMYNFFFSDQKNFFLRYLRSTSDGKIENQSQKISFHRESLPLGKICPYFNVAPLGSERYLREKKISPEVPQKLLSLAKSEIFSEAPRNFPRFSEKFRSRFNFRIRMLVDSAEISIFDECPIKIENPDIFRRIPIFLVPHKIFKALILVLVLFNIEKNLSIF